jgi:hypothetical protein
MRALSLMAACALLVASSLSSCTCGGPEPEPQPDAIGRIGVSVDGPTATIRLTGLSRSLRSLQVDVDVADGQASAIAATGAWDLVEAGLGDGPRAAFTAVVADTRRLPINNGDILQITMDVGARIRLRNAIAIDDVGNRQILDVETP